MKKVYLILMLIFLHSSFSMAATLQVESLNEFLSSKPANVIKVKSLENEVINDIRFSKDDIIYCELNKVTAPKRGKRDAKIYFRISKYENELGTYDIKNKMNAKYKESIFDIETLKNNSPEYAKKSALFVADHFAKGVSYGVNFATGFKDNKEGNRFKSGAKNMYEESVFSYVEKGEDIKINEGDIFYLVFKSKNKSNSNSNN